MVNVSFVRFIFQDMKDFNQQRGLVSKVLTFFVRVTMMSGPAVGLAKTFPRKNLSKVVHTSIERRSQHRVREQQHHVLKMSMLRAKQRMQLQLRLMKSFDPTTCTIHTGEPQIALWDCCAILLR